MFVLEMDVISLFVSLDSKPDSINAIFALPAEKHLSTVILFIRRLFASSLFNSLLLMHVVRYVAQSISRRTIFNC